jgi:pimeloyl-ACP methyl ester carboxylesterase
MPHRHAIVVIVAAALILAAPAARACPGDCDGDGAVTVDELIRGVRLALEQPATPPARCSTFDQDGDEAVAIDELTVGIGVALSTCPTAPAIAFATVDIASPATPAGTPGSPGVVVDNPKLLTQFGADADLNFARYTRFHFDDAGPRPDAILILVPGFEGGANTFKILAENLLRRARRETQLIVEVWAYDRRSNQLEDTAGLDVAEALADPQVALDWLYGGELGLALSPALAPLGRRAVFYDTQGDVPFLANWTGLVFTRDIDAVVAAARAAARRENVFLGGHSAGTGFTARYAATDFDLEGAGPPQPGYARLRGLVLLEGGGGSTGGTPLSDDALDRIIARADGGLFGAVRDNAPRCVDGTTPCTVAGEAVDCAGLTPSKCTPPSTAYSVVAGLLNPRILASVEVVAIQGITDPNGGQAILSQPQGGDPDNTAIKRVPDLATLSALPVGTVESGIGGFLDDDGLVAQFATFVATSLGEPGPTVDGLATWHAIDDGPLSAAALPDNGPPPTALPARVWGREVEATSLARMMSTFYAGGSNFTDWYYPSSGLSTTSAPGLCRDGRCAAGNVGATCATDAQCTQSVNLDSSALSIGRGRRDIENLTQAAAIDIPVIAFGGSNGLAPVPASFLPFARSIGPCAAPSCDGTPRIADAAVPNEAFPTFGGPAGGFEAYVSEGYSHVDVVSAEDDGTNRVIGPLAAFLARNAE